jgi:hypothetical protein
MRWFSWFNGTTAGCRRTTGVVLSAVSRQQSAVNFHTRINDEIASFQTGISLAGRLHDYLP